MQKAAHTDAVSLFETYAKDGDNAALKSFAAETLPTLNMHQDMIQKVATTAPASDGTTPAATSGATSPAAPVPGANSFTEAQAKSAIEKAGYADVSALTKDDNGVWRGTASKDGKSTPIALDYQGNVVAGTK
jgi:putative membrane protein